ncbi:hypothetical protein K439DRAFT_48582 [Ramaria rubella]|nr:hypothetical protein K439DRAFT_48582 [Ramaria rubella]
MGPSDGHPGGPSSLNGDREAAEEAIITAATVGSSVQQENPPPLTREVFMKLIPSLNLNLRFRPYVQAATLSIYQGSYFDPMFNRAYFNVAIKSFSHPLVYHSGTAPSTSIWGAD